MLSRLTLSRLSARWPLLLAVGFCVYALALLGYAFHSRHQLQAAADARLLADSKRRATVLGEVAEQRRDDVARLASLHEIATYLTNEALGMSPRYGLNASLDAVEQRFAGVIANSRQSPGGEIARVAYMDRHGEVLVDTDPNRAPLPTEQLATARAGLAVLPERDLFVAVAPVWFRGEIGGKVITVGPLSQLYRSLLQMESADSYHETLLTSGGVEIVAPKAQKMFSDRAAMQLAAMPADLVTSVSIFEGEDAEAREGKFVAVKTVIDELPVAIVTTMSRSDAYGHIVSSWLLYSASLFPIVVLVVAFKLDRVQRRARRLEVAAVKSDSQRQELQGQNDELRSEILLREAAERELELHRANLEALVSQRTSELNSLFHALPDLYFRMGRDGVVLDYRAGREADLYVRPEEFVGKRIQDVLPDDIARQIDAAIKSIADGGQLEVFEYGLSMPTGQEFYEARILPLDAAQLVVVVRNITDRRMVEEIRESHRTEAERLARIKSEFLANMSHEIRTPLNGVLGMARIGLRDSFGRGKAQETFERILQSGNLLLGIVNDILDFSKIEAGKMSLETVPLNLEKTLAHVKNLFVDRANAKGIELAVRLADEASACLGDPLRIEQILINLVSNAVKFTDRGKVTLDVTRAGSALQFVVTDTGIGMGESEVARLFTPFEQGDGSTTRKYGGTGLGLAITSRLVDLMGGSIEVESVPGQGSTFRVSLPLIEGREAQSLALTDECGPMAASGVSRLAGIRVLVAEDVELNRVVLEEYLCGEGAAVELVVDGRQAVEAVASDGGTSFDVVLMDIQMPIMDGIEATRRIKEIAPTLPIIGQTAHAMTEDRERCRSCGMVDHVAKPIELEDLVSVMLRHVRGAGVGKGIGSASGQEMGRAVPPGSPAAGHADEWLACLSGLGSSQAFAERITRAFVAGNAGTTAELRRMIDERDFEALRFSAHKLKGAIGNLKLPELFEKLGAIEEAAGNSDPIALTDTESILSTLDRLIVQAQQFLDGLPQAADA